MKKLKPLNKLLSKLSIDFSLLFPFFYVFVDVQFSKSIGLIFFKYSIPLDVLIKNKGVVEAVAINSSALTLIGSLSSFLLVYLMFVHTKKNFVRNIIIFCVVQIIYAAYEGMFKAVYSYNSLYLIIWLFFVYSAALSGYVSCYRNKSFIDSKKLWIISISILIISSSFNLYQKYYVIKPSDQMSKEENSKNRIKNVKIVRVNKISKASDELNKKLPLMVDEYTRLDNTEFRDNTFKYYHTIMSNYEDVKKQMDESSLTIFKNSIIKKVCTSSKIKALRDEGVVVLYSYRSKDKIDITNISVDTNKCPDHLKFYQD